MVMRFVYEKRRGVDEYPSISKKDLKTITKGKKIRYLKDRKNIINKYNLAYDLQCGQKKIYAY
mgnify:CR=1 FL=1